MPMLAFRVVAPRLLVDINRIPDLGPYFDESDGCVSARWCAGATSNAISVLLTRIRCYARRSRMSRITRSAIAARWAAVWRMPILQPKCRALAVTCDAEIEIAGSGGRRIVKAADFFLAALTTALRPGELIVSVRLPAWKAGRRWAFEEFARRRGDFALAGVALFYDLDADGQVDDDPHRSDRVGRHAAAAALRWKRCCAGASSTCAAIRRSCGAGGRER